MKTNELLTQSKNILSTYACKGLDGDERENMNRLIERFFSEHASKLDKSEIMEHMATPMKALSWFHGYVCKSYRRRCCTTDMPEETDACRLTG